jgi:signal transduction histidine kinase
MPEFHPLLHRERMTLDAIRTENVASDLDRAARLVVAGELVSSITHDLRQPLTAIEMNVAAALRLLERLDLSDHDASTERMQIAIAALHDALGEQHRMREALEVLQDLAAQREPSFGPLDLCTSVRDAVHLMASEASQRHVRFDVQCDIVLPAISADAALVRQALLSVLLEALEAASSCDEAQRTIRIEVRSSPTAGVEVTVTHFGARSSLVSNVTGLALARSVTEAHGASLAVNGDPLSGVTISTRWPLHRTVGITAPLAGGVGALE